MALLACLIPVMIFGIAILLAIFSPKKPSPFEKQLKLSQDALERCAAIRREQNAILNRMHDRIDQHLAEIERTADIPITISNFVIPLGPGPDSYTVEENGNIRTILRGTAEYNDLWKLLR